MRGVILLTLASVMLFSCIGCDSVDVSRYTADQVISVAKDYAGSTCSENRVITSDPPPPTQATWKVKYRSNGRWVVERTCRSSVRLWFFYEDDGRFEGLDPDSADFWFGD
jgi:hypothetical protein